LRIPCQR